jgi:hypothetical protein
VNQDPLTLATDRIHEPANRRINPMDPLIAAFTVTEAMDTETAKQVLQQLLAQKYLAEPDANLAQLLSQKLGIALQWRHVELMGDGGWREGREYGTRLGAA